MIIHRLVYSSTTDTPLPDAELEAILEKARTTNTRMEITGFLTYDGDCFVQLLEGPAAQVQDLYKRISTDKRHRDVEKLLEEDVEARTFSAWSMAYTALSPGDFREIGGSVTKQSVREMAVLLADKEQNVVASLFSHVLRKLGSNQ